MLSNKLFYKLTLLSAAIHIVGFIAVSNHRNSNTHFNQPQTPVKVSVLTVEPAAKIPVLTPPTPQIKPQTLPKPATTPTVKPSSKTPEPVTQTVQTVETSEQSKPSTVSIKPPVEKAFPKPDYPPMALRRGLEGSVFVEIHVNSTGDVDEIIVLESSGHKMLDEAALSVKNLIKYAPANDGHMDIAYIVRKKITFRISDY